VKYDFEGLKQFIKEIYNKMENEEIEEVEVDLKELKEKFAPNSTNRLTCFKSYIRKIIKDIIFYENLKLEVKITGDKMHLKNIRR